MQLKKHILLTGATGFIGRQILQELLLRPDLEVSVALRNHNNTIRCPTHIIGDLAPETDWGKALTDQQVVIHAAAQTSTTHQPATSIEAYRKANRDGTLSLARQAADAGVKRFIFLSSIKVNGENTKRGHPFSISDTPAPQDAYALSKHEAEIGLKQLANDTKMETCIIRPPLVYGPGVKGNLRTLISLIKAGIPLPLGSVNNLRSIMSLENLTDLIILCTSHPNAANQVFLACDNEDLSTPQFLKMLGAAAGKPARLLPLPESILRWTTKLLHIEHTASKLIDSLQIDSSETHRKLGWTPPTPTHEGIRKCLNLLPQARREL